MGRHDLKAGARFRRVVIAPAVVVVACAVLALISGTAAPAAVAGPAQAGLRLSVDRQLTVGDGTALLSVRLPGRGTLTATQASGGPVLLQPLHQRVGKAGSLTLVLKPTAAGQTLERQGRSIHLTALLTFRPANGGTITRLIPIVFDIKPCAPKSTFTYTGVEQACVVPQTTRVSRLHVIVAGAQGGNGPPGCDGFPSQDGTGGHGAYLDAQIPVTPGETLYIEVGGNGGSGSYPCDLGGEGTAGQGGWNGGGTGMLPPSRVGSGGGGGATDIQTVSCAAVCDQGGGFGVFVALASRIVVAGGGGGGGTGGPAGPDGCSCLTTGGNGGAAGWTGMFGVTTRAGQDGSNATISGTTAIPGVGGGGGGVSSGGAGGMTDPYCGSYYDPGPCTNGGDGHLGVGGYGGDDPYWIMGPLVSGYAGGGGGAGYFGGGGGDGGGISLADTVGGGGGGGGGSSFGPSGTNFGLNYSQPKVEFIS
jgi:hypothetical protein